MQRLKRFVKTTVLGGVIVILPVILTVFLLNWLFNFTTRLIGPLTKILVIKARMNERLADVLVILVIITVCFLVGLLVKTKLGKCLHRKTEKRILKAVPGYSLFRNTIKQFLGQDKTPFSKVALVQAFGNSTMMTGFVTDEHHDGRYTVFIPSALNPTTGLIFHLESQYVHFVDVSTEDTMRSIISCGAGSGKLINKFTGHEDPKPIEEKPAAIDDGKSCG
ncbi:MAG: DUF502 domain-containing protein [bacterium]|nr:DUF502 domain-containing protein [bacterium]